MANDGSDRDMHNRCGGAAYFAGPSPCVGLLLCMLVRSGAGVAGELTAATGDPAAPETAAWRQSAPLPASLFALPMTHPVDLPPSPAAPTVTAASANPATDKVFSTQEFRPRGRSVLDPDYREDGRNDAPMLRGTNVWQNLADYRSHDRVRLVTLWETSGSSVSLQAGRKGTPSLQWTSRLMNRGGATRGLFDQIFAGSLAGFARGLHFAPRDGAGSEAAGKPKTLAANPGAAAMK
jgi:hypothetical protein